jgi:hypothetical protein
MVRGRFSWHGDQENPPHPTPLRGVDLSPQAGRGKERHEDLSQVSVRAGHGWFFAT